MEYHNYFPLEKTSLRYKYFFYIDTEEYLADSLFIKHNVKVCFQQEAHRPDTDFIFVFCRIKKADLNKFTEALEDLNKKMLLLGHTNYPGFCKNFYENFLEQQEKI